MRLSIWPNAAATWESLLATATHAEQTGWDGVWMADHFMPASGDPQGPINEALAYVAGLAAAVPRLRLGTLVCGNTYRHPAVLAKQAATIDNISGGRLILGLGAGWQEREHAAYGIPFHTVKERLDRFEEACQLVQGADDRGARRLRRPLLPTPRRAAQPEAGAGAAPAARRRRRGEAHAAHRGEVRRRVELLGHARGAHAQDGGARPSLRGGRARSVDDPAVAVRCCSS